MLNLTQIYYQSNTSRTYHPSNYLKHLDLNFKITKMCFFHLKLLTTNIFFQSLLICIFEISIQFYGGTCGKCTKTSYYEEANKNNDNGGNREIKKNCLELLVSLGYSVTVGTWWRYDLMVRLASGNDTDTDWMVGLGSGTNGLGYPIARLKSTKTISVSYRHRVSPNFWLPNIPGLINICSPTYFYFWMLSLPPPTY